MRSGGELSDFTRFPPPSNIQRRATSITHLSHGPPSYKSESEKSKLAEESTPIGLRDQELAWQQTVESPR